jgi:hypothetical protein
MKSWVVTINYGVTTYRTGVRARDHEEAFWQALATLGLEYNRITETVEVKRLGV